MRFSQSEARRWAENDVVELADKVTVGLAGMPVWHNRWGIDGLYRTHMRVKQATGIAGARAAACEVIASKQTSGCHTHHGHGAALELER